MNKRRSILVTMMASLALVLMLALGLSASKAAAQGPISPEKISGPSGPATSVGSGFTYQGVLKENGAPANGTYDFKFDLYDGSGCCTLLGNVYLTKPGVNVVNGLFTVQLDFNSLVSKNLFDGGARYLHVLVTHAGGSAYTELSPNQALTAAPYALSLMPGAVISGTAYQELKVENYAPTGSVPAGVTGEMYVATDGVGVYGSNSVSAAGATGVGVWGRTWSPSGSGVKGTGVGGAIGVYGNSVYTGVQGISTNDSIGLGVYGTSPYVGVWGESTSTYAAGVQGHNDNGAGVEGNGGTWGVYGKSEGGTAVFAQTTSGSLYVGHQGMGLGGTNVFRVDNTGKGFFNGGYQTGGADVAEFIPTNGDPQPGDVVEIDPDHAGQFRLASTPNSTIVAGVISTQPGASLGAIDPASAENTGPQLALAGRVPVKVSAKNGAIHPGDLLVASSMPGYAMRAPANPAPGTVIGKALDSLNSGTGIIKMLVMLR